MAGFTFVLIFSVHILSVGSVEILDVGNLKQPLSRYRRGDPPAETSTVKSKESVADIDAKIKALMDQRDALLRSTTEARSAYDMSTMEIPVSATENEVPKRKGSKAGENIEKLKAELKQLETLMQKLDHEETEISEVQKEEESLLSYLLPGTSPPATANVEQHEAPLTEQVETETTLSIGTTPRSETAPDSKTVTGDIGATETAKDNTVTDKAGATGTANDNTANGETEEKKTDVTPKTLTSIETSSEKTSGGVLIYVIVVLVLIMVGYVIYVNKAKIKACYTGGEKNVENRSGTKKRAGINYEKLKKDDDDMTIFEKKALNSNYVY